MTAAAVPLYVDANATYPVPPGHYDEVAARLKDVDGNPSSIHARGRAAKVALEQARASLAALLGVAPPTLLFTAGATEANNLAIHGVIHRQPPGAVPPQVVVTATEHPSVIEAVRILAGRGLCRLAVAPVSRSGEVDAEALVALVDAQTVLVCLMHGNNETGAVNPVHALAARLKAKAPGVHVHADAVQLLGKADLAAAGGYGSAGVVDSAAFSGHKLGAYKGIGALYLKAGTKLGLLVAGGGQERGRRPGTENMPGIVSFGLRCDAVRGREAASAERMRRLSSAWTALLAQTAGAVVHGGAGESLPNTVNFHVDGVPGDDILLNFDLAGIHASSGSACSSGVARPSHVLLAMGYSEWVALNSVRVSFTADATTADLARMHAVLQDVLRRR